ncbi:uncharacterized protein C1orf131 homolog [Alligator mississippiensis]|uniref:uncharacterized protein C1orf131 homolog n=1 Tax=Alligator mississippiensis TaxID=8496 RepID=UPI0003D0804C|nr:uncharacterized protein C1orf131 homolog [Alligator mississippiensis]
MERSARCARLHAVLGALYDLGEEPAKKTEKEGRKKKKTKDEVGLELARPVEEDSVLPPALVTSGKRKSASRFFKGLKDEIENEAVCSSGATPASSSPHAVPPTSTQPGKVADVEVVTFCSWHKKKKPKLEMAEDHGSKTKPPIQEKTADGQEFNLEKARLEVHKFGITGYEKKEQRLLEQERAIMLGAKPPKKEYINYKIYQGIIKEKKTLRKEDNRKEYKSLSFKKHRRKGQEERKLKKKKSVSRILPTGQVGKFKNGTLVLSSCDIKKIKSSKVIK